MGAGLRRHRAERTQLCRAGLIMHALSPRGILEIWERGQNQHPLERALTILGIGSPEENPADWAGRSVGQRDAALLALRERTLGPVLRGFAQCPQCRAQVEFDLPAQNLRAPERSDLDENSFEVVAENVTLKFRLLNSHDLAAAASLGGFDSARQLLIRRCVTASERGGHPIDPAELSEGILTTLSQRLSECDPGADTVLELNCVACGFGWTAPFDIGSFFWTELVTQARRLLREVHTLAEAYAWTEEEILALSDERRRAYLEMVEA